ncbi:MAG: DUF3322 domain-containing protein [Rectinemataceae bacterium]
MSGSESARETNRGEDRHGTWTSPADIRNRLRRDWDSGRLPAALIGGETPFPLRVPLRGPSSTELGGRFDETRRWIADLSEAESSPGFRLEWRDVRHKQLGRNSVPVAAVFERPEDALAFAGREREASRLVRLAREVGGAFPDLAPWILRRPLAILEHAADWPRILGALAWFRAHPRSGRYARQIDAPGVHSKFVESHRGLLAELLDLVLEPGAIEVEASGAAGFARRYGLRDKPLLVRFRSLDPRFGFGLAAGERVIASPLAQIALAAEDFARLFEPSGTPPFEEVFVTENEINFLAFPDHPTGMIVFGGGYGFASLARADWLRRCRLRYWGDLDTHGFAILDQFRAVFPEAESFLMDRATLLAHRGLWTAESTPTSAELGRLRSGERELYDDLRADRLGPSLRLEQERIGFAWLESALGNETEGARVGEG